MYHYFAICDWLVEPSVSSTNELLARTRSEIAASDGRQVVVCPVAHTFVTVHFESTVSPPPGDDSPEHRWPCSVDLRLECPSGKIYIDQPTALAIDLGDALVAGAGTYAVRIAWRGRRTGPQTDDDEAPDDRAEEYRIQMWPTGPLSPLGREHLDDDEDQGRPSGRPGRDG
jgi:hypothetical protein